MDALLVMQHKGVTHHDEPRRDLQGPLAELHMLLSDRKKEIRRSSEIGTQLGGVVLDKRWGG